MSATEAARACAAWPGAPEGVTVIDPLHHPTWDGLLATFPEHSFFHGTAWAQVLSATYRHQPVYFCRFSNGRLQGLLPTMQVASRWTGRRGVSLPFTDFCRPLHVQGCPPGRLLEAALAYGRKAGWRYLECRGHSPGLEASPSLAFYAHVIELAQKPEGLFQRLASPVRRALQKAQRAALQVEFGTSLEAMRTYYSLHCRTRRRHGLPPQPFRFFENIARYVLEPGHGFIAIARLEQHPLAAAVYFHQGTEVVYKYGASNYAFQHLRPNNLVMWEAIRHCARQGFARLHLGRTSLANTGLRRFKLGFGAQEELLEYYKYDFTKKAFVTDLDRVEGWFNHLFRCLPPWLLRRAGEMLYPHLS